MSRRIISMSESQQNGSSNGNNHHKPMTLDERFSQLPPVEPPQSPRRNTTRNTQFRVQIPERSRTSRQVSTMQSKSRRQHVISQRRNLQPNISPQTTVPRGGSFRARTIGRGGATRRMANRLVDRAMRPSSGRIFRPRGAYNMMGRGRGRGRGSRGRGRGRGRGVNLILNNTVQNSTPNAPNPNPSSNNSPNNNRGRGGKSGRVRRGRRTRGRGSSSRKSSKPKLTVEQLNADLDRYHGKNPEVEKLNSELDQYMMPAKKEGTGSNPSNTGNESASNLSSNQTSQTST